MTSRRATMAAPDATGPRRSHSRWATCRPQPDAALPGRAPAIEHVPQPLHPHHVERPVRERLPQRVPGRPGRGRLRLGDNEDRLRREEGPLYLRGQRVSVHRPHAPPPSGRRSKARRPCRGRPFRRGCGR